MSFVRKMSTPKITHPGHSVAWSLLPLVGVLCGVTWYMVEQVQVSKEPRYIKLDEQATLQQQRIEALEKERFELHQQVAVLERTSQIDREAIFQIRAEVKERQSERLKLQEELIFLRGVVSSGAKKGGLNLQDFHLQNIENSGIFRYRFTVTQVLKNIGVVTGRIWISLDGKQADEQLSLPLKQITEEKTESIKMRFKHFQDVEGVIRLPQGFHPSGFVIEVKSTNEKLSSVSQRFDWIVQ